MSPPDPGALIDAAELIAPVDRAIRSPSHLVWSSGYRNGLRRSAGNRHFHDSLPKIESKPLAIGARITGCRRPRFPERVAPQNHLEPLLRARSGPCGQRRGKCFRQELKCYVASETRIGGAVHFAHTASTERTNDLIR